MTTGFPLFWCERWDLNPHAIRHTPLKRACLPVPALSHIDAHLGRKGYYSRYENFVNIKNKIHPRISVFRRELSRLAVKVKKIRRTAIRAKEP